MAPSGPPASKAAAKPEAATAKPKPKKVAKPEEPEEPKMLAPDKAEFDAAMEEIQKAIEDLQAQQAELGGKISGRSGGKDEYFAKRNEFRAQLDEFTLKIDELMARKEELNKGISDKRAEGKEMKDQLGKMKKSIGFTSEGAIDDRIADIDLWLRTETLTLKQEKDYMKEISELKRNRPKVGQVSKMEDSLASRDTGSNLRENIGTINEEMALYRDGKRQVSQGLAALNETRKDQLGDLPQLIEERDIIGKKVKAEMDKRNTLRDEFRQKERDFNTWRNEQRRAKQDRVNEERQSQQAEWDMSRRMKKAEEMDEQPYVSEITLIEQTIFFCKSLVADKGPAVKEEKKETSHTNPEGTEVMQSKQDRDEEFYYAPTAAKKKKGTKNKGGKEGAAKPIKHNAETFKLFDKLKLTAPITTEDIPAKLEALEAQLASYQEKVKAWEINRDMLKEKILKGEAIEEEKEKVEEKAEAEEKAEPKEEEKEEQKDE